MQISSRSLWPQTRGEWALVIWLLIWWGAIWLCGTGPWQLFLAAGGVSLSYGWVWLSRRLGLGVDWDRAWFPQDKSWVWWWVWLGVVGLSALVSQTGPVSWLHWQLWLASLAWFWWVGSLRPVAAAVRVVQTTLVLGVSGLLLASLGVAWSRPLWALHLPPLNFLVANFGHHHLAALIVLVWPIVWQLAQIRQRAWWGGVGLLLVGLISSFSRVANVIVLWQLGTWAGIEWWRQRQAVEKTPQSQSPKSPRSGWVLAGVIVILLCVTFSKQFCLAGWAKGVVCQTASDPRLEYWHQAAKIWQQYPWLGAGPGTFGAMARQWLTAETVQSQFAHNTWLELAAETGGVGIVAWALLVGSLSRRIVVAGAMKQQAGQADQPLTQTDNLRPALTLAILGSFLLSLFDFDWQLLGVWLPTLALVALLGQGELPASFSKGGFKKLPATMLTVILGLLSGSAVISLAIGWSVYHRQPNWWFNHWPGLAEWYSELTQVAVDPLPLTTYVQTYAPREPQLVAAALNLSQWPADKLEWQDRLWQTDPWRYWENEPFSVVLQSQNWSASLELVDRLDLWLQTHPTTWRAITQQTFARSLVQIARQAAGKGDLPHLQQAVQLAQKLDPWALNAQPPVIALTDPASPSAVLATAATLDQTHYGDQLGAYRSNYVNFITQEITRLEQQPINSVANAAEVETLGRQMLVLLPELESRPPALAHRLAVLLLAAGDFRVGTQTYLTATDYQLAQSLEPWVLSYRLWWFEHQSLAEADPLEILQFADQWTDVTGEKNGYKPAVWQQFYQFALNLAIERGEVARQVKYRDRLTQIQAEL